MLIALAGRGWMGWAKLDWREQGNAGNQDSEE
jgi:hypothetical protein